MEKLKYTILIASLLLVGLTIPVRAEIATKNEALTVAKNWITTIIHHEGNWGGSKSAAVEQIKEFKRGKRVVGYFCRVKPKGFIVLSLHKQLTPVKAYSATGYLDTESEEGLADMLKSDMERALNAIEKELNPVKSAHTEAMEIILEIDHRPAWEELEPDVQSFKAGLESGAIAMAYDPGTWLLGTNWCQHPPYNDDCPDMGCNWSGYDNYNENARVGCTATAAAQIMRYWSWPPWAFDWLNMQDEYIYDPNYNPPFRDGNANQVTQAQIDAIAELCSFLGVASGMIYRCDVSEVLPLKMAIAMETYLGYNAGHVLGTTHDMSSWHDFMITQLNAHRPVLYGNGGENHSYVVDGWKTVGSNDPNIFWHINYGWGGRLSDTWYSRDYPPLTDSMVRDIKPISSLGSVISGTYTGNGGYRYFDQDCTNYALTPATTFEADHNLQFLPGVKLRCESSFPEAYIRFEGTSSENTRLFSIKGTQSAGIKIGDSAIELYPGGGLRFLSRQVFTD